MLIRTYVATRLDVTSGHVTLLHEVTWYKRARPTTVLAYAIYTTVPFQNVTLHR